MSDAYFGRLLVGLLVQNGVFIGLALWWLRRQGRTLADIGLARPTWKQVLLGIGCGLVITGAGHWLGRLEIMLLNGILTRGDFLRLHQWSDAYGAERTFRFLPAAWMMAAFALVGSLSAPIAEELLFRGVLFHSLRTKWRLNTGGAIVGSSLLFAFAHVSPFAFLPLFVLGLAFAGMYVRTNSLWIPILMHVTNNVVSFALLTWGNAGSWY